jgi:hypothetical protein
MRKQPTLRTHAETEALVARLRDEGLLPPRGKSHEWVRPVDRSKVTTTVRVEPVSDIGDRVKAKFSALNVTMSKGCSCERVRQEMNASTSDEVMERIDYFVNATFANVSHMEGLIGFAIKGFSALVQTLAKKVIRRVIVESCDEWRATQAGAADA